MICSKRALDLKSDIVDMSGRLVKDGKGRDDAWWMTMRKERRSVGTYL